MADVIILGGGLAGLAAAAALGGAGLSVDLFESRPYVGGRATSYEVPGGDGSSTLIDNCQHVLVRCCDNLLDFYGRLGAADQVQFYREFYFLEPGGRLSTLKPGRLPAPLHFTESFLSLKFLSWADKAAIGRAMLALRRERATRKDLEQITMLQWLQEKRQTPAAIERFWRQVLVSAVNEELDRMAAVHGFQVCWMAFLARPDSFEMGVPAIPLGELYHIDRWQQMPSVRLHLRTPVEQVAQDNGAITGITAGGQQHKADAYVSALPFGKVQPLVPGLELPYEAFEHVPITGIHLWFDKPITDLPHGTLLDRTLQWFFTKQEGRYLQLVVSASRSLMSMPRKDVIDLALRELAEFLPTIQTARLVRAHVVKEAHATFSARPGLTQLRPQARTAVSNLFLAGDWTCTGWPSTMEGAVRSGYLAAEAVLNEPGRFLQEM